MSEKTYKFGTYIDTPDGKKFRTITSAKSDSDAQAELTAKQFGEYPEDYDLTDMNGDPLIGLHIRRAGQEWFTKF